MTVLAQEPVPDDLLPFGWVDCGVIDVVGDDTSDDDQDPGSVPVVGDGLIVFIPKITEMRVMRNGRSTLVRNRPVPANLDEDGVIELAGHRLVKLWHGVWTCTPGNRNILDFDQFDFELTGDYTLNSPAPLWHLAPYDPPDGVTVTTLVVPAGGTSGQALGWGGSALEWVTPPKGDPGDLTPATTATWNGTVALSPTAPATITATLTGNVTLTLTSPPATRSFTVTVVAVQDGTGSRTLAATGVTWPYGVPPVLTAVPAAADLIHFLWTGTRWIGLVGGQGIA